MSLTEDLKGRAIALGFSAVGITSADPFVEAESAAATRTEQGLMDGLSWWSVARAHASAEPRRATPDARSIIALAFPHPSQPQSLESPSPLWGGLGRESDDGPRGRIASYALGRDYHEVLLERMQPLVELLRSKGHRAKTYVDHGWMLDRAAAARAGLGWLGKNTNLLVPGTGSYVLLAEIVTSAELEFDEPLKKSCGGCDACIRICPTGALIEPGVLDNRRCISFWTIEHRGVIPREMRPLIDARPRLEELLTLDDDAFRIRFRQSAVWRTRRSGLLRNACIALGNVADRTSVPALAAALDDGEPLIRGHAAWALGRIGGLAARRALDGALSRESDAWVREECALALEECG